MNELRKASLARKTSETSISAELELDCMGHSSIKTGVGMLDHMLTLIFFWAKMKVQLDCQGDLYVDAHHSFEDIGLVLGQTLFLALGDKKGIERTAFAKVPMDEAMAEVSVDLSGRPWLEWRGDDLLPPVIAGEEKDVWREFYKAFASSGKFNLHVNFLYGKNGHHLLESVAKSFGIALREAVKVSDNFTRSTKGEID